MQTEYVSIYICIYPYGNASTKDSPHLTSKETTTPSTACAFSLFVISCFRSLHFYIYNEKIETETGKTRRTRETYFFCKCFSHLQWCNTFCSFSLALSLSLFQSFINFFVVFYHVHNLFNFSSFSLYPFAFAFPVPYSCAWCALLSIVWHFIWFSFSK